MNTSCKQFKIKLKRSSPKLTLCSALCESLIINRFTFLGQLNLRQFSSRSMRRFEAKNVHCTKELKSQKGKIDGIFCGIVTWYAIENIWNFVWFWRDFFLDFFNVKHFFPYYLCQRSFWYKSIILFEFFKEAIAEFATFGKIRSDHNKKASFSFQKCLLNNKYYYIFQIKITPSRLLRLKIPFSNSLIFF